MWWLETERMSRAYVIKQPISHELHLCAPCGRPAIGQRILELLNRRDTKEEPSYWLARGV